MDERESEVSGDGGRRLDSAVGGESLVIEVSVKGLILEDDDGDFGTVVEKRLMVIVWEIVVVEEF